MPSPSRLLLTALLALPLMGLTAGCVIRPAHRAVVVEPRHEPPMAEMVAPRAPPPPRYEVEPPPPSGRGERVAWNPGHWRWDGRDWDWVPGRFVDRPRRDAHWERGHWAERPNGWIWIEGAWR